MEVRGGALAALWDVFNVFGKKEKFVRTVERISRILPSSRRPLAAVPSTSEDCNSRTPARQERERGRGRGRGERERQRGRGGQGGREGGREGGVSVWVGREGRERTSCATVHKAGFLYTT